MNFGGFTHFSPPIYVSSLLIMNENELSNKLIGIVIHVHKSLGPGLLESAYIECMFYKISQTGLWVVKEQPMPLVFEKVKLDCGYRIDLFIENKLAIETKSVEALNDIHLLSY